MAADYIPRPNSGFAQFQKNLVKEVVDHAVAWNIPVGEVNDLTAASIEFNERYKILSNKTGRTMAQVEGYNDFRKNYEKSLRQFVNGFVRGNKKIGVASFTNMGIKVRDKKRRQRSAIDSSPDMSHKCEPGIYLWFWCRIEHHIGKASLHPESDGVEICFSSGNRPNSHEDCPKYFFSKKAHIRLDVKPEWRDKYFYFFARWKNLSNDNLSGPWSQMHFLKVY